MLLEELFSSMKEHHQRSVQESKTEKEEKGISMTRRLHELLDLERLIPSAVPAPKNNAPRGVKHNN
jgi:hypothetical protein